MLSREVVNKIFIKFKAHFEIPKSFFYMHYVYGLYG